ncbi:MAG: hypothetical protein ABSC19_02600 [Syntrophorhabdales bacterium]|jgi:hypothetical protein
MDILNPKVIAEKATRLLNEVRGNVSLPENAADSGHITEIPESLINKKDLPEERREPDSVSGLAENGLDLERIADIFESFSRRKTNSEDAQG